MERQIFLLLLFVVFFHSCKENTSKEIDKSENELSRQQIEYLYREQSSYFRYFGPDSSLEILSKNTKSIFNDLRSKINIDSVSIKSLWDLYEKYSHNSININQTPVKRFIDNSFDVKNTELRLNNLEICFLYGLSNEIVRRTYGFKRFRVIQTKLAKHKFALSLETLIDTNFCKLIIAEHDTIEHLPKFLDTSNIDIQFVDGKYVIEKTNGGVIKCILRIDRGYGTDFYPQELK